MAEQREPRVCERMTRNGVLCKNHPMKGSRYCYSHSLGRLRGVPLLKNATFHAFLGIAGIGVSLWFGLVPSQQQKEHMKIARETERDVKSIREMLRVTEQRQNQVLLRRYPAGYVLFGVDRSVRRTETVIPRNSRILAEYEFDWERVGVSNLTAASLTIEMPNIHYKPLNTLVTGTAMGLTRRPPGKQYRYPIRPQGSRHRIFVELLEDNSSQFVFLIGFKEE